MRVAILEKKRRQVEASFSFLFPRSPRLCCRCCCSCGSNSRSDGRLSMLFPLPAALECASTKRARRERKGEKREKVKKRRMLNSRPLSIHEIREKKNKKMSPPPTGPPLPLHKSFAASAIAACSAEFLTLPLDTAKVRLQIQPTTTSRRRRRRRRRRHRFVDDSSTARAAAPMPPQIQRPDRHDPHGRRRGGRSIALEGSGTLYAPAGALRR